MTKKSFNKGDFKRRAFFIDSNGMRYALVDVHFSRYSLNPVDWFFPQSPPIVVDIEVGEATQLALGEMKEVIINLVVRHRWYRQGDQSESEFRKMIVGAKNYLEIIEMISFYGHWQG